MRLADLPVADIRSRIVVSEADPVLFAGTLRRELDPWGRADGDDARSSTAVSVANAEDILDALPEGLDAPVEERGRSFSGGQRQRLVLTRALLSEAEVLVLVEPTSAVDAHTEARIADRLRDARAGRTTVIVTSSPLVLDRADRVVCVHRGPRRRRGDAPRAAARDGRTTARSSPGVRSYEQSAADRGRAPSCACRRSSSRAATARR